MQENVKYIRPGEGCAAVELQDAELSCIKHVGSRDAKCDTWGKDCR